MQDPIDRMEAENMCKMMSSSLYAPDAEHFDKMEDTRFHGWTYAVNTENVYKACLAGIRRQKY